ncbi:hypothetical protein LTR85_010141 [Meristemomyces frigidus]|nr:hypothetical protein LTR85_010141 [Meristemomyces frigidus]
MATTHADSLEGNRVCEEHLLSVGRVFELRRRATESMGASAKLGARRHPELDEKGLVDRLSAAKERKQYVKAVGTASMKHEKDVEVLGREVRSEMERLSTGPRSRIEEEMAKNRKGCLTFLDKTHDFRSEDETKGLKHLGMLQGLAAPLPRLRESKDLPLHELQTLMRDRGRTSWTMEQVVRQASQYRQEMVSMRGKARLVELTETMAGHRAKTIEEQIKLIASVRQQKQEMEDRLDIACAEVKRRIEPGQHQATLMQVELGVERRVGEVERQAEQRRERELRELRRELEAVAAGVADKHAGDIKERQAVVDAKNNKIVELNAKVTRLADSLDKCETELRPLKALLQNGDPAKNDTIKDLQAQLEKAKEGKRGMRDERDDLQKKLNETHDKWEAARQYAAKQGTSFAAERAEHEKAVEGWKGQVSELEARRESAQNEVERLQSIETGKVPELQTEISQLTLRVEDDTRTVAELKETLSQERGRTEQVREAAATQREEMEELQVEMEKKDNTLADLERENEELKASVEGMRLARTSKQDKARTQLEEVRAENVTLKRALKASLPATSKRFSDEEVVRNLIEGACVRDPATEVRVVDWMEWDLAMIQSDVLEGYVCDNTAARRLWFETCCTDSPTASLAMIEVCLAWAHQQRSFTAADRRFVLAAVQRLASHIQATDPKDWNYLQHVVVAALRAMELALRIHIACAELESSYAHVAKAVEGRMDQTDDPILHCMFAWVGMVLQKSDQLTSLPEMLLKATRFDGILETDRADSRTLIGSTVGVLIVDAGQRTVVEVESKATTWRTAFPSMDNVIAFTEDRRRCGELRTAVEPMRCRDSQSVMLFLSRHLRPAVMQSVAAIRKDMAE